MNPALMVSPWLHYTYYQQKLTDYAKELAKVDDPNDPMTQRQLARDMNIRFDDLTCFVARGDEQERKKK